MQIQINLPTRKLKPSLDKIVQRVLEIRKEGIDLAKKTFNFKNFDFNNPFHEAAAINEVEDQILSKQENNALYIGTIKAKKDLSNKFVTINFFLIPTVSHDSTSGAAYLQHLEVHITARTLFKEYEEILALLFHEIKHFLQINRTSQEYQTVISTLKKITKDTDKDELAQTFSLYHTDIAEFETTLTELITTMYYKFLRLRKSSGNNWRQVRKEILDGLQNIISNNVKHAIEHIPNIFPRNTKQFFTSIHLSRQPNIYWSHVQEHLSNLYKRLSNTW